MRKSNKNPAKKINPYKREQIEELFYVATLFVCPEIFLKILFAW